MITQTFSLDYFQTHEPQLFHFWDQLTVQQQRLLIAQLEQIDLATLQQQKKAFSHPSIAIEPFEEFAFSGNQENISRGKERIQRGEVGCLVLAGGQGTRLGHEGPKGTYPISCIKQKSLFQLCAEKVKAASVCAGRPLQLAILTSPENDEETKQFFQKHHLFGLQPDQLSFCRQETLPLLDEEGKMFLKTPHEIATGANGNGNSLLTFAHSGLLKKWLDLGIKMMTIILIDNPLADPFDAELIGFHAGEITLKCTEKKDPEEKVGLLVKQEGRCAVVEYSEMPEKEKNARRSNGKLKHCCANLSLFCMSLAFIERMVKEKRSLPLHKAWKAAQFVDHKGAAWKSETFIFDWLAYAHQVAALIFPREECFAPLKNHSGADSPQTVREALQNRDRAILQSITGLPVPTFPFELPAEFYYPSNALKARWKGKQATPTDFEALEN